MANKIVREIIHAKGIDIGIYTKDFENEYISLTDIAKYRNDNDPRFVIQNWMRNRNTVEFLAVWEELHNPNFNRVQFEAVRSEAGLNRFVMTPTKWIEQSIIKDELSYSPICLSCIALNFSTRELSGKLAYGRRKNEKVSGTRNEYRIVKQENYMLHDGIHEGIISETDWELAHQKREKTGVKYEKTHSLDHEHILSGILRCPLCGSGMYGNVNRKKKKDGTLYKDYFYYACKHRRLVDGHKCGYRKQWSKEKINNAVEEVIRKLVKNPKFEEAILNKIGSRIDTEEIEKEIERLEKQHKQLTGAKARLGQQMDSLDIMDKFYEKKYQDMETRLYRLYDESEGVENSIEEVKNRLLNIRQQKISEENVYQFLLYFDKLYDKFTDLEKKEFLNSFVEQVDIYEQEQPDGRFLKHIKFRFPVYFGDRETQELCWDNESTVETCVLLSKLGQ